MQHSKNQINKYKIKGKVKKKSKTELSIKRLKGEVKKRKNINVVFKK